MAFKANESLAGQIAQHLGQQIITGDLVEGERIQELRIAKELNVSRGSVREALLILERRHLIDIFPRRGAVVSEMSAAQIRSLYEVVVLMLGVLARKAAAHMRSQDAREFMTLLQDMKEKVDAHEIEAFHEASFEFFRSAYRFADNNYVIEILEDLQPALRRSYYMALHMDRRELEEAYGFLKGVVSAVIEHDGDTAARLVAEFIGHLRDRVLESLLRVKEIELAWAQRSRR